MYNMMWYLCWTFTRNNKTVKTPTRTIVPKEERLAALQDLLHGPDSVDDGFLADAWWEYEIWKYDEHGVHETIDIIKEKHE